MSNISTTVSDNEIVTFIISNKVLVGKEKAFEQWLKAITQEAIQYEGHLGVNYIRPVDNNRTYTTIVRFDNYENLNKWIRSERRKQFVNKASSLVENEPDIQIQTGLDYWFTPLSPKQKAPKRWKQFVVTMSAIYPLALLLSFPLTFVSEIHPVFSNQFVNKFLNLFVLVGMMTFLIMPKYTKFLAKWLYR